MVDTRIVLTDSAMDAIAKMADGDPGAISVMVQLLRRSSTGLLDILWLDTAGLYGSDIWIAFKDVCGENVEVLVDSLHSDATGLADAVRSALETGVVPR